MHQTYFLESTDSTNRVAWDLAKSGAKHGAAVLAERQEKGRGRLGRVWVSPPEKGVYCSIVIRPDIDFAEYAKISMVAGVAVADAIDKTCGCTTLLKWPNDIFIGSKKAGGILAEAFLGNSDCSTPFVIVGIGVNVNNTIDDFSLAIQKIATSILIETHKTNVVRHLFEEIHKQVLLEVVEFQQSGFSSILARWKKKDCLRGKEVKWITKEGMIVKGISDGPDESGRLIVRDEHGKQYEVISGDIQIAEKISRSA